MIIKSQTTLQQKFKEAIEENYKYIAVIIKEEGMLAPTLVIDNKNNFQDILEYYKENYDDNLKHIKSDSYIIEVLYGENLSDFEFMYDTHDMYTQVERVHKVNCMGCKCESCGFITEHNYGTCHNCGEFCGNSERHCDIYGNNL